MGWWHPKRIQHRSAELFCLLQVHFLLLQVRAHKHTSRMVSEATIRCSASCVWQLVGKVAVPISTGSQLSLISAFSFKTTASNSSPLSCYFPLCCYFLNEIEHAVSMTDFFPLLPYWLYPLLSVLQIKSASYSVHDFFLPIMGGNRATTWVVKFKPSLQH